jgi:hypothetical protein
MLAIQLSEEPNRSVQKALYACHKRRTFCLIASFIFLAFISVDIFPNKHLVGVKALMEQEPKERFYFCLIAITHASVHEGSLTRV